MLLKMAHRHSSSAGLLIPFAKHSTVVLPEDERKQTETARVENDHAHDDQQYEEEEIVNAAFRRRAALCHYRCYIFSGRNNEGTCHLGWIVVIRRPLLHNSSGAHAHKRRFRTYMVACQNGVLTCRRPLYGIGWRFAYVDHLIIAIAGNMPRHVNYNNHGRINRFRRRRIRYAIIGKLRITNICCYVGKSHEGEPACFAHIRCR